MKKCVTKASRTVEHAEFGASWTPMADPIDFRPINLMKKVNAGADFIQTQGIYDVEGFHSQHGKDRKYGSA